MGKDALSRIKTLTLFLSISLTFNVFFIAFFLFEEFQSFRLYSPLPDSFFEKKEEKSVLNLTLAQVNTFCESEEEPDLIYLLKDQTPVELGYKVQDLAFACLVTKHDFDYKKIPLSKEITPREVVVEGKKVILFKGLETKDFEALWHFGETECYPFTAQGLFRRIQRGDRSQKLLDVFMATPPFLALVHLFNDSSWKEAPSPSFLLELSLEGPFSLLEELLILQKQGQALSKDVRHKILKEYLKRGSPFSALFFIQGEKEYALKNLSDEEVLLVLDKIPLKNEEGEVFATELLSQPRGDRVWAKASEYLYSSKGLVTPLKFPHHAAVKEFLPNQEIQVSIIEPSKKEEIPPTAIQQEVVIQKKRPKSVPKVYMVQTGDSLWKIARRFHTEVEILKAMNNLKSDALKPGSSLLIP